MDFIWKEQMLIGNFFMYEPKALKARDLMDEHVHPFVCLR